MFVKGTYSRQVASILLEEGAVEINSALPFVYASGILSPIYCDLRLLMGVPEQREKIVNLLVEQVSEKTMGKDLDFIAGTATAGIPWAAWVAGKTCKPLAYVRDSSKGHGKGQQVEGGVKPGHTVVVIEDLTSTGSSGLQAVAGLRQIGARVCHAISIFTYELPGALDAYEEAGVELISLCGVSTLLQVAELEGKISDSDAQSVRGWLSKETIGGGGS
jgi:orotate phosphoribosyltransferase